MKKLLLLPFFVLSLWAHGQYDPSKATVTNKPLGVAQGVPTDARSYYYSPSLFIWRPYQSTAEVLSSLNIAKFRMGNFPIYVNVGGTLNSNGTFTGGTIKEYWFKDGTTDADLVEKFSAAAGETLSGTVAQLRALTTGTGKVYTSTDRGGGSWVDIGVKADDDFRLDDGATLILSTNNHWLQRQITGSLDPKWWGADPTGTTSSTAAINAAIASAKAIRNAQGTTYRGKNIQIGFTAGKYLNTAPIQGAVGVDLVGTGKNDCVLFWNNKHSGGIIMNETGISPGLEFIYTNITGLSVLGGSYMENPFAFKSPDSSYVGANGIELHNHRVKINNCSIEGWNETGITATSVYYIYVDHSFIKNNKIAYLVTNVSTSNFITYNEIRLNGNGILINGSSFGNYINHNTIESNFSNFLPQETSSMSISSKGKGVIINGGANSNFIDNNYIENHYSAFALGVATNNQFSNNTIIPALNNPVDGVSDFVTYYGSFVVDNKFLNNSILFYADTAKANIRVLNAGIDYSTNIFTFDKTNFDSVISHNLLKFKGQFLGVEYLAPTIANEAKNLYYRGLQLDTLKLKINGVGKDAIGNITINTDNIFEGPTNKFTQWANVPGGIRYNNALGIGVNPQLPFHMKFATDKNIGIYYNGTNPVLNTFNENGLPVPITFYSSAYNFTTSPVTILPGTTSTHGVNVGQLTDTLDARYAASQFTIGNADGAGDTVMIATVNSATFKRVKPGNGISISSDATSMTISSGVGTVKVLPNADYTITTSDHTLILTEVAANRTITLPAASTMPNKEINLSVRATTTGRWLLSGSFVQKSTVGANPISENFVNSGLPNGLNYRLVSDGVKWYDINN